MRINYIKVNPRSIQVKRIGFHQNLPALYLSMMPENVIPEWVQPTGSHDAYNTGDKVIFEGNCI